MVCFSQARGSHVPRFFFFFFIRSLPLLIYESGKSVVTMIALRTYFRETSSKMEYITKKKSSCNIQHWQQQKRLKNRRKMLKNVSKY